MELEQRGLGGVEVSELKVRDLVANYRRIVANLAGRRSFSAHEFRVEN